MILVVDYGLGNLLSVAKALEEVADTERVVVSRDPRDVERASHIVLPGVGNFKTGIENLSRLELIEPLTRAVLEQRTPFLGICLGMQLLASVGEEYGERAGLGLIPGRVRMIAAGGLKLPHIGWDDLDVALPHPLFKNIARAREFYFVHSYCIECPPEHVVAWCSYGERFAAVVQRDNIYGTQFHPEKSRGAGLTLLRNFLQQSC